MSDKIKQRFLEQELTTYLPSLTKAADTVQDEGVSNYPIFVAHQVTTDIGIPIIDREKVTGNWSINLSSLEEFSTKNLIATDKIDEFRELYQSHEADICFFVLSELGATFNFLPKVKK
ncbi:MAG: hypothetical protein AAGI23_06455 [Bacteroidota bacterium]